MEYIYIIVIFIYIINLYANYYVSEKLKIPREQYNKYTLILSLVSILALYIIALNRY